MGFYEDATPAQQALLSVAEHQLRKVLATCPPDTWQALVGLMGPEAVLTWAKTLAQEEQARLTEIVVAAQAAVDEVAAVLAAVEE